MKAIIGIFALSFAIVWALVNYVVYKSPGKLLHIETMHQGHGYRTYELTFEKYRATWFIQDHVPYHDRARNKAFIGKDLNGEDHLLRQKDIYEMLPDSLKPYPVESSLFQP